MTNVLILSDIDGVVANISHRLHYLTQKDYDNFYGTSMIDDTPIKAGKELIERLERGLFGSDHCETYYLTGRPERTRSMTTAWMQLNYLLNYRDNNDSVIMRKDGDYRPSPIIKVEQIKKLKKKLGKEWKDYDYIYFIDDDPENCLAVFKEFPQITCITFGADRMFKNENDESQVV